MLAECVARLALRKMAATSCNVVRSPPSECGKIEQCCSRGIFPLSAACSCLAASAPILNLIHSFMIGTFRSGAMADAGFFRVCCHHFNAVFVASCVVSNRPQYSSSAHHHHHTRARVWSRTTASQTRTRSCSSPSSSSPSWTPRCALRPSSSSMAFRSC